MENQLVLHSDNGRGTNELVNYAAKLQELGVMPSFAAICSDDNPYSESLFRTMKYRPQYPEKPFKNLTDAGTGRTILLIGITTGTASGINFVTPSADTTATTLIFLQNAIRSILMLKLNALAVVGKNKKLESSRRSGIK